MRISKLASALCLLLVAAACGPTSNTTQGSEPAPNYVGGWDGAETRGNSVLLLRDDFRGALTSSLFGDSTHDYRLGYEVVAALDDETNALQMNLACVGASRAEVTPDDATEPLPQNWEDIDCAGWELELACSLAGDCDSGGGCNMICDIVDFGDAYARTGLALHSVEREFDMWYRV